MTDARSDSDIIKAVLKGDAGAFRVLVDRHGDSLYRFCLSRLGSPDEAEDALQDTFIRAYKSLGSFDLSRSFKAWAFGIAANRVKTRAGNNASRIELAGRVAARVVAEEEELQARMETESLALASLARESVRRTLDGLPESYRIVLELYYFSGLKVDEIAQALKLGHEAVKSRLFRARKEMAKKLSEREQPNGGGEGRE